MAVYERDGADHGLRRYYSAVILRRRLASLAVERPKKQAENHHHEATLKVGYAIARQLAVEVTELSIGRWLTCRGPAPINGALDNHVQ